jgi:hypothetical protein
LQARIALGVDGVEEIVPVGECGVEHRVEAVPGGRDASRPAADGALPRPLDEMAQACEA